MSSRPATYTAVWLWEDRTGFTEEFSRLYETRIELQIAIAPQSYPEEKFTKDEALELESQISKDMIKRKFSGIPKYITAHENDGVLLVVCTDENALCWLHSYVKDVKYKKKSLKVGVQKKIPLYKISFLSPEAQSKDSAEELLNALILQNKELSGFWAVKRIETEETRLRVTCFVDNDVLMAINRNGNKAYLGMHQITVNTG